MEGTEPAEADFAMLRAALEAAQSATPTARANAAAARAGDAAAPWNGPFGRLVAADGREAWRGGSFSRPGLGTAPE